MTEHQITIGGNKASLSWTQKSARQLRVRSSRISANLKELFEGLNDPKKAEYSGAALLWILAPDDVYEKYSTPEKLWLDVEDSEIETVLLAIIAVLSDMMPDAEKKTPSKKSPSRKSS